MTGAAFGAAISGMRPVLEIMFGDFLALSMDSLINQASKYWFLTQGRQSVPLVIRSVVGAGGRFGAIHSQMPISWLTGVPGLKIVAPSTPTAAKGLLKAAIRDPNPVLFFEHKRLYSKKGSVEDSEPLPIGAPKVVLEGSDITLVSAMKSVDDCLEAAADARLRGHLGGGHRPADDPAVRRADDPALAREDQPHRRRRGGAAAPAAGPGRCSRWSPSRGSATSTTRGESRRPTRRSPTVRRSRTPSFPERSESPTRCAGEHDRRGTVAMPLALTQARSRRAHA